MSVLGGGLGGEICSGGGWAVGVPRILGGMRGVTGVLGGGRVVGAEGGGIGS